MIKYLDVMEWLQCLYDPQSYAGRNLSPGRSNLARHVNGRNQTKSLRRANFKDKILSASKSPPDAYIDINRPID